MPPEMKNSDRRILIVGAGPAGTGTAIRLANAGFEVTLVEREKFPRQKLCGEFISPECFGYFAELGVLERMLSAGGARIAETIFYEPGGKSVGVPSQWFEGGSEALGLSRAAMDNLLLERAAEVGVRVLPETSVGGLLLDGETVCGVNAKNSQASFEIAADLTIDATGRAAVLDKLAVRELARRAKIKGSTIHHPPKIKNHLVGFKAHLKNVSISHRRCEIYFFRGGYGGLNYIENGAANHCFLIKSDIVRSCGGNIERILDEVVFTNVRARETLCAAKPIFDWLTVAIDKFGVKNLTPARGLAAVGDAGAFIDPFTGSGMLMALESGKILADCISQNPNGSLTILAADYRQRHQARFSSRLSVSGFLRRAAFTPSWVKAAILLLSLGQKPVRALAKATRFDSGN